MRSRNKQFLVLNTSCATVINLNKKRKNILFPLGIDLHKRVNVVHLNFCFFFSCFNCSKKPLDRHLRCFFQLYDQVKLNFSSDGEDHHCDKFLFSCARHHGNV